STANTTGNSSKKKIAAALTATPGCTSAKGSPCTRHNKLVPARDMATSTAKLLNNKAGHTHRAMWGLCAACSNNNLPTKPDKGGIPITLMAATKKAMPQSLGCCSGRPATKRSMVVPLSCAMASANKNKAAVTKVE